MPCRHVHCAAQVMCESDCKSLAEKDTLLVFWRKGHPWCQPVNEHLFLLWLVCMQKETEEKKNRLLSNFVLQKQKRVTLCCFPLKALKQSGYVDCLLLCWCPAVLEAWVTLSGVMRDMSLSPVTPWLKARLIGVVSTDHKNKSMFRH